MMTEEFPTFGIACDIDDTISDTGGHLENITQKKFGHSDNFSPDEKEWVERQLLTNEFYDNMPTVKGAQKALEDISALIPIYAYISSRPTTVLTSTTNWLIKNGFPKAAVLLRDNIQINGHAWKADILMKKYPDIRGIIDDSVELADALPKNYKGFVFILTKKNYKNFNLDLYTGPRWGEIVNLVHKVHKRLIQAN
ncbi:hypothetical protein KW783_00440 [Candidatus Parcubacteria bacterium]|nr:hypothetical protein [Candidatus Parcubacteria bacterium]